MTDYDPSDAELEAAALGFVQGRDVEALLVAWRTPESTAA